MKKYYYPFAERIKSLSSEEVEALTDLYPSHATEEAVEIGVKTVITRWLDSGMQDAWFEFETPLYDADTDEPAFGRGMTVVHAVSYDDDEYTLYSPLGSITLRF